MEPLSSSSVRDSTMASTLAGFYIFLIGNDDDEGGEWVSEFPVKQYGEQLERKIILTMQSTGWMGEWGTTRTWQHEKKIFLSSTRKKGEILHCNRANSWMRSENRAWNSTWHGSSTSSWEMKFHFFIFLLSCCTCFYVWNSFRQVDQRENDDDGKRRWMMMMNEWEIHSRALCWHSWSSCTMAMRGWITRIASMKVTKS